LSGAATRAISATSENMHDIKPSFYLPPSDYLYTYSCFNSKPTLHHSFFRNLKPFTPRQFPILVINQPVTLSNRM